MRTWSIVMLLVPGCLKSSNDCGTPGPGESGTSLVVHVMSPVDFDQVTVVWTIGLPRPPFTINTPTGRTYDYEYSSGFYPDGPSAVHIDALSGGVEVAHGDVTNLSYNTFDEDSCSYRSEVPLVLAP